jgi:hypothetical protein
MVLSQTYIDDQITLIETLHSSFANEFCNILKRHTGDNPLYEKLDNINISISVILTILNSYTAYGNSIINDEFNYLTEDDIVSLIDYCKRVMNKFQFNIYTPVNPNIYL